MPQRCTWRKCWTVLEMLENLIRQGKQLSRNGREPRGITADILCCYGFQFYRGYNELHKDNVLCTPERAESHFIPLPLCRIFGCTVRPQEALNSSCQLAHANSQNGIRWHQIDIEVAHAGTETNGPNVCQAHTPQWRSGYSVGFWTELPAVRTEEEATTYN